MTAFRHAIAVGADMVELDTRAAADGTPVVVHDATLQRTHGVDVPVGERSATELAGLGVPTLEEALAACEPLPVTVELKHAGTLPEAVAGVLRATGRAGEVIAGSFDVEALRALREAAPEVATSLADEGEAAAFVTAVLRGGPPPALPPQAVALQVPPTYQDVEIVTPAVLAAAHQAGLALHVWTVDEPEDMRAFIDLGVDGIITDRPSVLRDLLDESR